MLRLHDTIAALATPLGTSAIAVVRASGPACRDLAKSLFGAERPPARFAVHADYHDHAGALVDDVLYTFFQAPASYTGEDSLEISCHGNPYIAQRILEDLFTRGCRPAEPGEFTQRAFLLGKMDLTQAEAVMDIIHARSERALETAHLQLRGSLGRKMEEIIQDLLGALARLEAYIDFPDEDLPAENRAQVAEILDRALNTSRQLLATSHYGELLREGIRTVIIGEPNAGKSSLLNRLVGRDRAIVSPIPGTTRDFIEEGIQLGPHYLRLVDTAGLNPSPESLEKLGIDKTYECLEEAELFVLVLDSSKDTPHFPLDLLSKLEPSRSLLVLNKADLETGTKGGTAPLPSLESVRVSALTGTGIEALRKTLQTKADALHPLIGSERIAINARHAHALTRVQESLSRAREMIQTQNQVELLSSELRDAMDACGEISGKVDNERMLDQLFSTFCIGK